MENKLAKALRRILKVIGNSDNKTRQAEINLAKSALTAYDQEQKEAKEVPPGIVKMKLPDGEVHPWNPTCEDEGCSIHTISVDGKEWSVGDNYKSNSGSSFTHQIKTFSWVGYWRVIDENGDWARIAGISKLSPKEESPASSEEKSKTFDDLFNEYLDRPGGGSTTLDIARIAATKYADQEVRKERETWVKAMNRADRLNKTIKFDDEPPYWPGEDEIKAKFKELYKTPISLYELFITTYEPIISWLKQRITESPSK